MPRDDRESVSGRARPRAAVMRRARSLVTTLVVVGLVSGPAGLVEAAPVAPGFRVKLLDDAREIDSRELLGTRVIVVRFQASWCRPCVRESAALNRLAVRYRDRGVEVIAFHVQDAIADARRFVRVQRVTYPVALDPRLAIANRFGLRGTPYTIVIDKKGEMVARLHGENVVSRLPRLLDELLREPKAASSQ